LTWCGSFCTTLRRANPPPREAQPVISPEEMQRRHKHVQNAKAAQRLEGMQISPEARGEIEAADLVTAYVKRYRPAD
jgi:hypothetical protein